MRRLLAPTAVAALIALELAGGVEFKTAKLDPHRGHGGAPPKKRRQIPPKAEPLPAGPETRQQRRARERRERKGPKHG